MTIEKHIACGWSGTTVADSAIKVASWRPEVYVPPEISDYIKDLKADPRFRYVHLIAMSDGDSYGQNLNGDIFQTDELTGLQTPEEAKKNRGALKDVPVQRYKTFETARLYKDHDNRPTSPAYGDVGVAGWNPVMRRVELVIRIAKSPLSDLNMRSGEDIIKKLDRTGKMDVSMGTTIDHEQCTYCRAKNAHIHQRCPHLATMMGRVMPNGVKVAALNFGVNFFDISDVPVPADPIANSLAKVAGATTVLKPNFSVDVLEDGAGKLAEILKSIPMEGRTIADVSDDYPEQRVESAEDLNIDDLSGILDVCGNDPKLAMGSLAAFGVSLQPTELFILESRVRGMDKTAAHLPPPHVRLDNIVQAVYDVCQSKIQKRSGFLAPPAAGQWDGAKLAELYGRDAAIHYQAYRVSLGALPADTFKAACRLPAIKALHGGDPRRVKQAMNSLIHSGLATPAISWSIL
jgi:hypothetical protein